MASYVIAGRNVPNDLREEVLKRDEYTCQYCGRCGDGVEFEIDHIIPVSKGGKTDIRNLITACKECNRAKRDKLPTLEELRDLAARINSSLEYLTGLIGEAPEYTGAVRISFLLDPARYEVLGLLSVLEHKTLTAILTEAVDMYIREHSRQADILSQAINAARSQ